MMPNMKMFINHRLSNNNGNSSNVKETRARRHESDKSEFYSGTTAVGERKLQYRTGLNSEYSKDK